jgi:hypothetical protein
MPKLSPNYNPSRHGTGWATGMPNDAAIKFLEGPYTSTDAKIQWLQDMGVTIPAYLLEDASEEESVSQSIVGDNNIVAGGDIVISQEPEELQNRTTTHYLINWPGTGFNYRLQRRLSETRQLQNIRQTYRENRGS